MKKISKLKDLFYILDENGDPKSEPDQAAWEVWMFDFDNRRVALDELGDGVRVSTVFLGIDYSHLGGPPVLWETMIFGLGGEIDYQKRYTSLADALKGHQTALNYARVRHDNELV